MYIYIFIHLSIYIYIYSFNLTHQVAVISPHDARRRALHLSIY